MLLEIATALLLAGAWGVPATASEEAGTSENEVRAVIANWYGELARKSDGRVRDLVSFDLIDVSPHSYYPDTGSAALVGPPVYDSLRARALEFRYTIYQSRLDENFGKVRVEERGYLYAYAAQKTYELHANTTFVMERSERDGRWRILAHSTYSQGFAPERATNPMPDLRDLYYATEGRDRDPAADAAAASKF